jgi:hypothetical protein
MRRGASRRAALAWLALGLAAWAGCLADQGRLLGIEGRDRETLDALYPKGTPRSEIRARVKSPLVFSTYPCDARDRDRDVFLGQAIDEFREEHPGEFPDCDIVRVARTGWGTIIGAVGLYQDYVFYDEHDHVLTSYRTFLHKTGLNSPH